MQIAGPRALGMAVGLLVCGLAFAGDPPGATLPAVTVTATLPGANPEEVAAVVAAPLERAFSAIAGVQSLTSSSKTGNALITIQFHADRPLDSAAADVQRAITRVQPQLPPGTPVPLFKKGNPSDPPVLYIALTSRKLSLHDLTEFAESELARRISMTPDIGEVAVYGGWKPATRIRLDADAMAAHGISIDQVDAAIKPEWESLTPPVDWLSTKVASHGGSPVRLGDIATVESVAGEPTASWYNQQRAVTLAVKSASSKQDAEIRANIRKLIPEFQARRPGAIEIDVIEYLPDSVLGSVELTAGAALPQNIEYQQQAMAILANAPDVESTISVLGGQVYVQLKKERRREVHEAIAELRRKLARLPAIKIHFWNAKAGRQSYTITDTDSANLTQRAARVLDKLRSIPAVEDEASNLAPNQPFFTLQIDHDKAQALGITPAQIEKAFSIANGRHRLLQLKGNAQVFTKLLILGHDGQVVPVSAVTLVTATTGPAEVNHAGLLPSVTFWFDVRPGVKADKVIAEISDR